MGDKRRVFANAFNLYIYILVKWLDNSALLSFWAASKNGNSIGRRGFEGKQETNLSNPFPSKTGAVCCVSGKIWCKIIRERREMDRYW